MSQLLLKGTDEVIGETVTEMALDVTVMVAAADLVLSVTDVAGGETHLLWDGTKAMLRLDQGGTAAWAPDGSRVAFSVYPLGCGGLDCPLQL